jgi:hypothetical protein
MRTSTKSAVSRADCAMKGDCFDMLTDSVSLASPRKTFAPAGAIRDIVFPGEGQLRARKVVTRSRQRAVGRHSSWKSPRTLEWESAGELAAFRLLDTDPAVAKFSDQPCRIVYEQDGELRTHIPDILVEYGDRKEFWEVKSKGEAAKQEFVDRTALMRDLNQWGYGYRLILSEELIAQPRLQNVTRLLYWGGVRAVNPSEREFIRLRLIERRELAWGDACRGAYGQYGREILCRLTMEGMLTLDLGSRWTDSSVFVAAKEGR